MQDFVGTPCTKSSIRSSPSFRGKRGRSLSELITQIDTGIFYFLPDHSTFVNQPRARAIVGWVRHQEPKKEDRLFSRFRVALIIFSYFSPLPRFSKVKLGICVRPNSDEENDWHQVGNPQARLRMTKEKVEFYH